MNAHAAENESVRRWGIDPLAAALLVATLGALFALFHFLGNTADVRLFSRSAFRWMVIRWSDATLGVGDYSHGWLIPVVSAAALWRNRLRLLAARGPTWWPAAGLVALGLAVHWVGARAQQPRLSLAAFIFLLWAIPCFLYGRGVGRPLLFPCLYLVFCIPMNFFDSFSFQLRMLATAISAAILNGLGVAVVQSGSAILAADGTFALEVADPCSGVRSLLAMTALTLGYAYFAQRRLWKRATLFASAIPLAIAGNAVRVISIGGVACIFGQKSAIRYYHDYSGYIVFVAAVLLLLAIERLLNRLAPERA